MKFMAAVPNLKTPIESTTTACHIITCGHCHSGIPLSLTEHLSRSLLCSPNLSTWCMQPLLLPTNASSPRMHHQAKISPQSHRHHPTHHPARQTWSTFTNSQQPMILTHCMHTQWKQEAKEGQQSNVRRRLKTPNEILPGDFMIFCVCKPLRATHI